MINKEFIECLEWFWWYDEHEDIEDWIYDRNDYKDDEQFCNAIGECEKSALFAIDKFRELSDKIREEYNA
uniref:Uncharacterized protein n=1 Tax=viral metagenome TaxID=1070528 RepID=A0A6M3LJH0_9ZZZZ